LRVFLFSGQRTEKKGPKSPEGKDEPNSKDAEYFNKPIRKIDGQ